MGPSLAAKLATLGIYNLQDLLFHLPLRYQDRTRITPIAALHPLHPLHHRGGGGEVVIEGEITACDVVFGRKRSLLCRLQDSSGTVSLRFFHFSAAQKQNLKRGVHLRCFGEARRGRSGFELYHPEYKAISADKPLPLEQALTPIYPSTEGLNQNRLRPLIQQAFAIMRKQQGLVGGLVDALPAAISAELGFVSLTDALEYLHKPPVDASLSELELGKHPAQQRLAFEELLTHNLSLLRIRQQTRTNAAPALVKNNKLANELLAQLPFKLTGAQQRVAKEVSMDLSKPVPMLRLVQGDVGSGKTLIAVLAALQAVENGFQAAIMAPTEILAEQHYLNFCQWLEPLQLTTAWLSGKLKGKKRAVQMAQISSGQANVVVGTHALFQEDVSFAKLGLVIIDEQHRFGVHQRLALREKGIQQGLYPHQLIMTATPIPRTLAMSAYADLDCSVVDELPPGRTPINTVLISNQRREQVIERIRLACTGGRQAYWVCTLIDESEALQCQAAETTAEQLQQLLTPLNIGLVHGRLKSAEKTQRMQAFKKGEIQLLVATTVIEVGVDVSNASLMIIENPERLGLAQLHQLRGRIGRGSIASHCLLMYQLPLSQLAKQRLSIIRDTNDGFLIAEKDLQIRGPGEVLGTKQTGIQNLKIADLCRDSALLPTINHYAKIIQEKYPSHIQPLVNRWLGHSEKYGNV